MNIMDFWSTHGLNDLEEDIQIRRLVRQVAHLQAIADITDRVIGNQSVYYDTFDGTNDHSPGKVDLAMFEECTIHLPDSNDQLVTFKIPSRTEDDANIFEVSLKVGQEVSIVSPDRKKYTGVITRFRGITSSYLEVRVNIPNLLENENYMVCRSMIKIVDEKCYLHPRDISEHDIRVNISLGEGENQTYTFITWVEHEKDMSLSDFTATPVGEVTRRSKSIIPPTPRKVVIEQVEAHEGTVNISWDAPSILVKTYIFQGICKTLNNPNKLIEVPSGTNTCTISNLPWGKNDFTIAHVSEIGEFSMRYGCISLEDTLPPSNIENDSIDISYISEDYVKVNIRWDNPKETDFVHTKLCINGDNVDNDLDSYEAIFRAGSHLHVVFTVSDENGNTNSTTREYSLPTELEYFGYKIDFNHTYDPTESVSYIGNCVGIDTATSTGLGGWANRYPFSDMKVCMVDRSTGDVVAYVNKDDYSLLENGETNTFYKNQSYMTMVRIPKMYTCTEVIDGVLFVKFSKSQILPKYKATHFIHNGEEKDTIFISSYPLTVDGACQSGKPPVSYSLKVFNNILPPFMKVMDYKSVSLVQKLFVLAYKSLDSRGCLGIGCKDIPINGTLDRSGFVCGEGEATKFIGIENIWGGISQYISDMCLDSNFDILISGNKISSLSNTDQYIVETLGTDECPFLPINGVVRGKGEGFCDRLMVNSDAVHRIAIANRDILCDINPDSVYGEYSHGDGLGIFSISFNPMTFNDIVNNIGARSVMYI